MLNYEQQYPKSHTNKFIVLHGVPYLCGEYVDRTRIEQIDPCLVGDGIVIDQSEPMRSIIDIQVSDIDRVNSNGRLNTIGNSSKLANMIDILKHDWPRFENRLRILRSGLLIRVFYQLENARTGIVLRSINESFRIEDPNYFIYVNPEDISDNSLIVNFSDSKMTSVSQFTYGRDPMVLRITGIQFFYEAAEMNPMRPRVERRVARDPHRPVSYYGPDADAYYYHQEMQDTHHFENWNWRNDRCQVPPETWTVLNRFYHYDEELRDFQIHFNEVYSKQCKVIPLACGKINLSKTFIVNPGTRLVFKFCIWKNDAVLTNNCAPIADALRIPMTVSEPINVRPGSTEPVTNIIPYYSYENRAVLPNFIPPQTQQSSPVDYAQNKVINQLIDIVANLELKVAELVSQSSNVNSGSNSGSDSSTPSQGSQNQNTEPEPQNGGSETGGTNEPTESEHTTSGGGSESDENGTTGSDTPNNESTESNGSESSGPESGSGSDSDVPTDPNDGSNTSDPTTEDDEPTEPSGETGDPSQNPEPTGSDPDSGNDPETP